MLINPLEYRNLEDIPLPFRKTVSPRNSSSTKEPITYFSTPSHPTPSVTLETTSAKKELNYGANRGIQNILFIILFFFLLYHLKLFD